MPSRGREKRYLAQMLGILPLSARHNLARWQRVKHGRHSARRIKGASISSKFRVVQTAQARMRLEFTNYLPSLGRATPSHPQARLRLPSGHQVATGKATPPMWIGSTSEGLPTSWLLVSQ